MSSRFRCIPLTAWWDPAYIFETLYRDDSHAFWLDAGVDAGFGASYLGAANERSRFVTASVEHGTVTVSVPGSGLGGAGTVTTAETETTRGTIFDFLDDDLRASAASADFADRTADDATAEARFRLGWVGWLGYELGAQTVGTPAHRSRYPDAALLHVDRAIRVDHAARTVSLLALESTEGESGGDEPGGVDAWAASVERMLRVGTERPSPSSSPEAPHLGPPTVSWRHSPADYADLVRRCQEFIGRGDAYQLCLTNEITVDFPAGLLPHPLDAYLALRAGSPSHHGGLLRFGDHSLLSASPEQFVTVTPARRITTKPIKGTRPRSSDPVRDEQLRAELVGSDKERAENLMIVDLMRNDLGRIAVPGSVLVTRLLAVESYRHVHQLVSTIQAQLAGGVSPARAVAACFPAGSMTGAPKVSAMTILDGLEGGPRGIYSGAFGYLGRDGAVDLAMVIRSIVLGRDRASIGTGGGITALSDPLDEVEETRVKAAALLAALAAVAGNPAAGKL